MTKKHAVWRTYMGIIPYIPYISGFHSIYVGTEKTEEQHDIIYVL